MTKQEIDDLDAALSLIRCAQMRIIKNDIMASNCLDLVQHLIAEILEKYDEDATK